MNGEQDHGGEDPRAERCAGFVVAGRSELGPVVVGGDGRLLNALLLPPERAETALRSGLGLLGPHEHRQQLVDVGAHRDGVVLITGPAVVGTLESVLESGAELPPGVVVTVLAPIVAALRDCVGAGVHPVPAADAVGLTAEGRPVLLLSAAGRGAAEAEVCTAVRDLLGRCRRSCPEWRGSPSEADDLEALEALLYRSAVPLPLALASSAAGGGERTGVGESSTRAHAPGPRRHRRTHPLDGWRDRLLAVLRQRRGPLAAAVVVVAGALAMTTFGADRGTQAEPAAVAPRTAAPAVTTTAAPVATASATPPRTPRAFPSTATRSVAPSTAAPARPATSAAPPPPRPPAAGLPPEEAATALLASARDCGVAAACAAALTTADSPMRADWAEAVGVLGAGGTAVTAVLADVNGASAVVSVGPDAGTTTASVLMIRTEAVWLLRDVFTDASR